MRVATIRASAFGGWKDAMLVNGLDPQNVNRPADIDETAWEDGAGHVTLRSFVSFSEEVGRGPTHIALPWRIGENYDLALLDEVGRAVLSATTLGSALRRLGEHFPLLQDATELRLDISGESATMSYRILDPDIWPRHHDAMFSLAIIAQIIKRAKGAEWDKTELAFEAEARDNRMELSKTIGTSCNFGADTNQISMPLAFLDLPMPMAEGHADMRSLSRQLVAKRRATSTVDRVSAIVFRELNEGRLNQEQLACEIGMSSRTLRRRLAEEGYNFQQILDDCRMRQAAFDFRTRPDLSIAQIALRLGYSEHSTFTRAFSRWSGMSPQLFRHQLPRDLN